MIITNPLKNINAIIHRHRAHVVLKEKSNSIGVYEFIKKRTESLEAKYRELEFCDAATVNELLQTKGIHVLVLTEEDRVIGRNWIE